VKYAWIKRHERTYPRKSMCEVLGVSESGFAEWRAGSTAKRWLTTPQLEAIIRAIHDEFNGAYGAPRMTAEIKARGLPASRERVRKLMQANGIRARHKRRYKATTNSAHNMPVAENLLNRQFETSAPDQVWTADITYIPTAEGWLYLAVVMDLYTRMIVGYSMDSRMTKELVLNALRMARFKRKPKSGLMHHSDRGSQYCSHDYQALLEEIKAISSMSRKGNCWDNAPMESWFNSLKNERVFHRRYESRDAAKADLFDYIEVFYNRKRRHSGLGYDIPNEVYSAWLAQQKLAA
jgi:putative transposase